MKILRHTIYNAAGSAAPIIVSLATVPLYLSVVGLERYGLLSICWLLLGYFGLFDLGLGRATTHRLASLRSAPAEERSRIFWMSIGLTLILSVLACVFFLPLAALGLGSMKLSSPALQQEIWRALPWLAACLPLAMLNGVLSGSLAARDRFLDLNLVNAAGATLMAVVPLMTALLLEPRLDLLVAASFLARALSASLLFTRCIRAVPLHRPRLSRRDDIISLAKYGGWVTAISAVGPLLSLWDRFAVGVVLGATMISYYVVPFNLVGQARIFPVALSEAIFPKLSGLAPGDVAQTTREAFRAVSTVMTPAIIAILMVIGPFLMLWVGPDVARKSAPVGYILLVGIWANSLALVPGSALMAQGRPDLVAKTQLAEMIPYAALLYVSMTLFGLPGVAFAWAARCVADALILFLLCRVSLQELRPLVPSLVLICGAVVTCFALPLDHAMRWLILAAILAVTVVNSLRNLPPSIRGYVAAARSALSQAAREQSGANEIR